MDSFAYMQQEQATDRAERVKLGESGEVREPEMFMPGLLLKGQSHLFFGASDTGKSWLAQYAARETMSEGLPVLYLDLENGVEVLQERMMGAFGVSREELDGLFYYYPFHDLALDDASRVWFGSLLAGFEKPGLVVYDSLLGYLSVCGVKENQSDDFEQWARSYLDLPRLYGWTPMVLDHTGYDTSHARGTSRKLQSVQVAYKVEKKERFDRTGTGRLKLTREKDRTAYLPTDLNVRLGGTPFEFAMRYDGQEFLNDAESTVLRLLPGNGARHKGWKKLCTDEGMSNSGFDRAVRELKKKKYVKHEDSLYYKV